MSRVMVPCERATLLVEKKWDRGLSIMEKIQLALHTSMCDACTNYRIQSNLIEKLLSRTDLPQTGSSEDAVESMKMQILQRLNLM